MKFLEGKTLAEKQMHYYNGSRCPYCNGYNDLVNSEVVYGQGRDYGLLYYCKPCSTHVGCHPGTDQSMGTVAKKPLRDLRRLTHNEYFNPLWEKKMELGFSKKQARSAAYKWVAQVLNITREEAHVGFFTEDQCNALIAECKKYKKGTKENEEFKANYEPSEVEIQNLELLTDGTFDLLFDLRKISETYYDLIHPEDDKKVYRINVKSQFGIWVNDKSDTWKKIPSLEKFIKKHFKKDAAKNNNKALQ